MNKKKRQRRHGNIGQVKDTECCANRIKGINVVTLHALNNYVKVRQTHPYMVNIHSTYHTSLYHTPATACTTYFANARKGFKLGLRMFIVPVASQNTETFYG